MGASATPSRRPLGITILLAVLALGAIATLPVGCGLFVGLIDPAFIGLGSTGLSGPALALALFGYTAFALVFGYGLWTLRRWGWWFGLVFLAGSTVSDVVGGIVGWQPPLISAAFIPAGLLVIAYWLRPSIQLPSVADGAGGRAAAPLYSVRTSRGIWIPRVGVLADVVGRADRLIEVKGELQESQAEPIARRAAMASIGQAVVNTATGERVVFLALNRDTAGELLKADGWFAPGGAARGMHIHPQQEERFEVLDGSLRFRMGREERIAKAGDVVVVPPGTPHLPSNIGEVEAHCMMEFRPALNTETFFENAFAMLNDRGSQASAGMILEFSELLAHFRPEFRLAPVPLHLMTRIAAPFGRLAGYRPRVPVQA